MTYFSYFPQLEYDQKLCTNMLARAKVKDILKKNNVIYYPYTVQDDDRPDIIAHKYYGSPMHSWIIFYVNDIFDVIFGWPLGYHDFCNYVRLKYGSIAASKQLVKLFKNADNFIIDEESYNALSAVERSVQYAWDWEVETNDAKRQILLLENVFVPQVLGEMRNIFNQ